MWNKAAEEMYGLPRDAAIGRNVTICGPNPTLIAYTLPTWNWRLPREHAGFSRSPYQDQESRRHPRAYAQGARCSMPAGKATHLLVIADDITTQLADQARLRDS